MATNRISQESYLAALAEQVHWQGEGGGTRRRRQTQSGSLPIVHDVNHHVQPVVVIDS
jgi:hypothetical protein